MTTSTLGWPPVIRAHERGVAAQGLGEPELVQGCRTEVARHPPYLVESEPGLADELGRERVLLGIGRASPQRLEAERHPRQRGAEAVVEVASEPAPLLLPRGHERLPRPPELTQRLRAVGHGARLCRERAHEPGVARVEIRVASAQSELQHADVLASVAQGIADRSPVAYTGGRCGVPLTCQGDGGERQVEGLAHRVDHLREHVLGVCRRGEPVAEGAERLRRVLPRSVDPAVDAMLQTGEPARQDHGGDGCGECGEDPHVGQRSEQGSGHERRSHRRDDKQHIGHRAAQHPLDVEEVVAQHAGAEADRREQLDRQVGHARERERDEDQGEEGDQPPDTSSFVALEPTGPPQLGHQGRDADGH